MKTEDFETQSAYYQALASPVRLQIIDALEIQPQTLANLMFLVDKSRPGVYKDLKILIEAGIVEKTYQAKDKRRTLYILAEQVKGPENNG